MESGSNEFTYLMGGLLVGFILGVLFANQLLSSRATARAKAQAKKGDSENTREFDDIVTNSSSKGGASRRKGSDNGRDETDSFI